MGYADSSCPTISYNYIANNTNTYMGGGISCDSSSPTISDNIITSNTGAAVSFFYGGNPGPVVVNNTITNHATGIYM